MHTTITTKIRTTESKCIIQNSKCLKLVFQFLVVAKIGCENVQLKLKTVKVFVTDISIFSCSQNRFEIHFISIKFHKTAFKLFQGFSACFLVR